MPFVDQLADELELLLNKCARQSDSAHMRQISNQTLYVSIAE